MDESKDAESVEVVKSEVEREDRLYEREVLVEVEEFVYVCERLLELEITRCLLAYLIVFNWTGFLTSS